MRRRLNIEGAVWPVARPPAGLSSACCLRCPAMHGLDLRDGPNGEMLLSISDVFVFASAQAMSEAPALEQLKRADVLSS